MKLSNQLSLGLLASFLILLVSYAFYCSKHIEPIAERPQMQPSSPTGTVQSDTLQFTYQHLKTNFPNVILTTNNTPKGQVIQELDSENLRHLEVYVQQDTLFVLWNSDNLQDWGYIFDRNSQISCVKVGANQLKSIEVEGFGAVNSEFNMTIDDLEVNHSYFAPKNGHNYPTADDYIKEHALKTKQLDLVIRDQARAYLIIDTEELNLTENLFSGRDHYSSGITLYGQTNQFNILHERIRIDAERLEAKSVHFQSIDNIPLINSGKVTVQAIDELNVNVSGMTKFSYFGQPKITKTESGTARVVDRNYYGG